MGHDLRAGLIVCVAVAASRNGRRRGLGLAETALAADRAVAEQFGSERFATGLLARIDTDTGRLHLVCCGHPVPLLVREERVVREIVVPPVPPLGLGDTSPQVHEESLQPGDRLLFYTDGIVDAHPADHELSGIRHLTDAVRRHSAAGRSAPEMLRRLMHSVIEHHDARLRDDATMVVCEWPGQGGKPFRA